MSSPDGPDVPVVLRCSTIVFRDDAVLLVGRPARGDWVLPGGQPRSHEGVRACARREVREETGLEVDPGRCAFVLDTIDPTGRDRIVEIVFLSPARLGGLVLRPPLAGYVRSVHSNRDRTAPYPGNLWRSPAAADS